MMKRLFTVMLFLLVFSAPAFAQNTDTDPAAYLPARTPFYFELRGEAGFTTLEQLLNLSTMPSGIAQTSILDAQLTPLISDSFPGVDFRSDILSWAGERIGVGAATFPPLDATQAPDFMIVLPIRDERRALLFVQWIAGVAALDASGSIPVYRGNNGLSIAVGTSAVWLSTEAGIERLLSGGAPENLAQNPAYQQVRAALPADAPLTAYLSGRYLAELPASPLDASPLLAPAQMLLQAALRLHPAQSEAEDALMALPSLNGIGATAQVTNGVLDVTAALSLEAEYPAPTLATGTAGTALLNLIPGDSSFVFASYDVTTALLAGGLTAAWGTPLASDLSSTAELAPAREAVSVERILAQVQPVMRQAESTLGLSLDELYALVNGEYALAAFPRSDGTTTAALYLQTANARRLIEALETASRRILTSPTPAVQWFTLERANVGGVEVAFVSGQGLSERVALALLDGMLVVTPESALQHVLEAASGATPSPAIQLSGAFGEAQEAFFYAMPEQLGIGSGLASLWGTLDARENGLFVLRLQGRISG